MAANVHLHPADAINNNNAHSRSTNLHNTFHTRHREKNRKNKQQNHYYIKQHYYPYNRSSSSQSTSIRDDQYQIEMSKTHRLKPFLTYSLLILLAIFNHI